VLNPGPWEEKCLAIGVDASPAPCGSNTFASAFEELEPIPKHKATAKLAGFLQAVRPS